MTNKLPETCYVFIAGATPGERVGLIKRGETGYYKTDFDSKTASAEIVHQAIGEMNDRLGVDKAEAIAMEIGSMFGWNAPGADAERVRNSVQS
ncbi:MAG TPA: hypothetical protein VK522_18310 [Pseudolabrys sp.]|nr:hypothetical protein [Pseudolabrys sp.]